MAGERARIAEYDGAGGDSLDRQSLAVPIGRTKKGTCRISKSTGFFNPENPQGGATTTYSSSTGRNQLGHRRHKRRSSPVGSATHDPVGHDATARHLPNAGLSIEGPKDGLPFVTRPSCCSSLVGG